MLTADGDRYVLRHAEAQGRLDPCCISRGNSMKMRDVLAIEQAIFSQEEEQALPLACQTQFFKTPEDARLTVVAHITTKGLRFARVGDRSKDKLTMATAAFDENGNPLKGYEKTLDMQLKDATLDRLNRSGINIKSAFDLQPGNFLVRIVVRDFEGAL